MTSKREFLNVKGKICAFIVLVFVFLNCKVLLRIEKIFEYLFSIFILIYKVEYE